MDALEETVPEVKFKQNPEHNEEANAPGRADYIADKSRQQKRKGN
jgi:hypothetical protein